MTEHFPLPLGVVAIGKGTFRSPSIKVANSYSHILLITLFLHLILRPFSISFPFLWNIYLSMIATLII